MTKCKILTIWASFLKKLCRFSKNYRTEHWPKKRLGLFFHETRRHEFMGEIVPCLTSFVAQCGNFLDVAYFVVEIFTFCLLFHSYIQPAVLPSTIYLLNLSSEALQKPDMHQSCRGDTHFFLLMHPWDIHHVKNHKDKKIRKKSSYDEFYWGVPV